MSGRFLFNASKEWESGRIADGDCCGVLCIDVHSAGNFGLCAVHTPRIVDDFFLPGVAPALVLCFGVEI